MIGTPSLIGIPGDSIGPFKLGMTRSEVDVVRGEFGGAGVGESLDEWPGILLGCDERDRVAEIQVRVMANPLHIVLLGERVNDLDRGRADALFKKLGVDISEGDASIDAPDTGLSACRWEHADEVYYTISVFAGRTR
jgi:hypothetical protein